MSDITKIFPVTQLLKNRFLHTIKAGLQLRWNFNFDNTSLQSNLSLLGIVTVSINLITACWGIDVMINISAAQRITMSMIEYFHQ